MKVIPVRAFRDNYIWLLIHGPHAVAVDPGDAIPVMEALAHDDLQLAAILITHHHADHTGGVAALVQHWNCPVFAPRNESYAFDHIPVKEGDQVSLPGIALSVLDVPGHTAGHVAYYGGNHLFCGDTLFGCGCGRIFDGTASQLFCSLKKLGALPDETLVYPAHEYTLGNLEFTRSIDSDNAVLASREILDHDKVRKNLPTLPSTLGTEKATNPFLRCTAPAIITAAQRFNAACGAGEEAIFTTLREMKNLY